MLKGLDAIRESIATRGQGYSPEGGLPELSISSGEVALIHFLTDQEDIIETRFHRVSRLLDRPLSAFDLPAGQTRLAGIWLVTPNERSTPLHYGFFSPAYSSPELTRSLRSMLLG